MATEQATSVGVYDDLATAERTIDELRRAGFGQDEIGIIGHVGNGDQPVQTPASLKAPEENATRGVMTGGVLGAVVGALVMLILPGLAWVSGLGRPFEILGGAVLGAAIGGALLGFSGVLFSRPKARLIEGELEKGRFVVTVNNPGRRAEAVAVLERRTTPGVPATSVR